MTSLILSLLAQADPTGPMSPPAATDLYGALIALSDRWIPFLTIVAGIVSLWLKMRAVEKGINGRVTQLIAAKDETAAVATKAAHAEGKLEGRDEAVTEVLPKVAEAVKPLVEKPRDPHARTRASDTLPPTHAPAESDPSTHQP